MLEVHDGSGGGGEILLLDSGLVFQAASKAAARRKRDAALPVATAFDADGRRCVTLRWRGRQAWQARRGGTWVDVCVSKVDADED